MVVVPWIPLVAIDVEVDVPFVFVPLATLTKMSGIHQIYSELRPYPLPWLLAAVCPFQLMGFFLPLVGLMSPKMVGCHKQFFLCSFFLGWDGRSIQVKASPTLGCCHWLLGEHGWESQ